MRPTKASDIAKQAISRFEGVRRRDVLNMAVTTKASTDGDWTAIGAVMMLMMAIIRFVVKRCET